MASFVDLAHADHVKDSQAKSDNRRQSVGYLHIHDKDPGDTNDASPSDEWPWNWFKKQLRQDSFVSFRSRQPSCW